VRTSDIATFVPVELDETEPDFVPVRTRCSCSVESANLTPLHNYYELIPNLVSAVSSHAAARSNHYHGSSDRSRSGRESKRSRHSVRSAASSASPERCSAAAQASENSSESRGLD